MTALLAGAAALAMVLAAASGAAHAQTRHVRELDGYVVSLLEAEARRLGLDTTPGVPDLIDRAKDYKGTVVGKVTAGHEYPATEGFRPRDGYFSQSPECERLMRMYMERCAFSDFPHSQYWKTAGHLFPTGKPKSRDDLTTANFIGNLMAQAEPLTARYHRKNKAAPPPPE